MSGVSLARRILVVVVVLVAVVMQWRLIDSQNQGAAELPAPPAANATPLPQGPLSGRNIGLLVGHWSADGPIVDPGAICENASGQVTLTELDVTVATGRQVVAQLEELGARVWTLEERDERLRGLTADLALSLHADSCMEATGYKAAYMPGSDAAVEADAFVACLRLHYEEATGLPWHAYSITPDMTQYHMHEKVHYSTPSVILEMGFLGGDRDLLTNGQADVVRGIVESVRCFFLPEENPSQDEGA